MQVNLLDHLNLSIKMETIVSIKEMEEVTAAKNTRIKKQSENSIIHLQMVCMDCWEKMVREKQH